MNFNMKIANLLAKNINGFLNLLKVTIIRVALF